MVPIPFLIVRDRYDGTFYGLLKVRREYWLWLFGYETVIEIQYLR